MFLLGFILYRTFCPSWIWVTISFPMLGKFLTIISSNVFSDPFYFSSFVTPIIRMLVLLMLSQRSLRLSSILFILFFFFLFCSVAVISTILSSSSLICSSALIILLLIPSSVFFTSVIVLFITAFCSSVLLGPCQTFLGSPFYFCGSILFSRSWIILRIITMNSFSGRLPISSSFIWSYGFLPCSFICNIFFCHLILSDLLCLWSPFCRLQGHSSSCFQCICPLIGEGVTGACVGFFLGGSGVCAVVGGAESCALMGWTMSDGVLGVVCELSMTLGSLSVDG